MINEKKIKDYRFAVTNANAIFMVITVMLQALAFSAIRHIIMCYVILMLTNITLMFDVLLKCRKDIISHGFQYCLWLTSLLLVVLKNI